MSQLTRFVVGAIFFSFGCSAIAMVSSGRYFAKLPPGAGLPEVWADTLVLVIELGIGLVGLKMLTSLLRQQWRRIDRGSSSTNALHTGTHRSACE
jgi:hypothetical protein